MPSGVRASSAAAAAERTRRVPDGPRRPRLAPLPVPAAHGERAAPRQKLGPSGPRAAGVLQLGGRGSRLQLCQQKGRRRRRRRSGCDPGGRYARGTRGEGTGEGAVRPAATRNLPAGPWPAPDRPARRRGPAAHIVPAAPGATRAHARPPARPSPAHAPCPRRLRARRPAALLHAQLGLGPGGPAGGSGCKTFSTSRQRRRRRGRPRRVRQAVGRSGGGSLPQPHPGPPTWSGSDS